MTNATKPGYEIRDRVDPYYPCARFFGPTALDRARDALTHCVPADRFYIIDRVTKEEVK